MRTLVLKFTSWSNQHPRWRFFGISIFYFTIAVCTSTAWHQWVYLTLNNQISYSKTQMKNIQRALNTLGSTAQRPTANTFSQSDFKNPAEVTLSLRKILVKHQKVQLLSLHEKILIQKPLNKLLNQVLPSKKNLKVSLYEFQIKLLTGYKSFLSLLDNIEQTKLPLFWKSVDYQTSQYPKAVITLKFYILSKK